MEVSARSPPGEHLNALNALVRDGDTYVDTLLNIRFFLSTFFLAFLRSTTAVPPFFNKRKRGAASAKHQFKKKYQTLLFIFCYALAKAHLEGLGEAR